MAEQAAAPVIEAENAVTVPNPCTFREDFVKSLIPLQCVFYRPLPLRPIKSKSQYKKMKKAEFCECSFSYPRRNNSFPFAKVDQLVQRRFIELLPPLTAHQFARTNKYFYQQCMKVHGLQFSNITIPYDLNLAACDTAFRGIDGMLLGCVKKREFIKYMVCRSHLTVSLANYLRQGQEMFTFVKRYKAVYIKIDHESIGDSITDFFNAVLHPRLEHLYVIFDHNLPDNEFNEEDSPLSLSVLLQILDLCKSIKTCFIYFANSRFEDNGDGLPFSTIQGIFQSWISKNANLEFLIFFHKLHAFHWRKGMDSSKIRRCVKVDEEWSWTEVTNIYDATYETYSHSDCLQEFDKMPNYRKVALYEEVVECIGEEEQPRPTPVNRITRFFRQLF